MVNPFEKFLSSSYNSSGEAKQNEARVSSLLQFGNSARGERERERAIAVPTPVRWRTAATVTTFSLSFPGGKDFLCARSSLGS